jgi:hypothetical protein
MNAININPDWVNPGNSKQQAVANCANFCGRTLEYFTKQQITDLAFAKYNACGFNRFHGDIDKIAAARIIIQDGKKLRRVYHIGCNKYRIRRPNDRDEDEYRPLNTRPTQMP